MNGINVIDVLNWFYTHSGSVATLFVLAYLLGPKGTSIRIGKDA
jgi:hypothetical protein